MDDGIRREFTPSVLNVSTEDNNPILGVLSVEQFCYREHVQCASVVHSHDSYQ